MTLAPIALFVYNRPEHTRQTVEALLRNPLAAQSELFIFSDAAKTPETLNRVEQVRAYIRTVGGFKSVQVIEREKNHGLANSIIDGVTKLCDDYGRVIVLEDDLVVAPTFLNYMNEALAKYQDNEKVMQISGYMFPLPIQADSDAFFLPFTTSWGWATWKRAWEKFDPEAKAFESLKVDAQKRRAFDLDNSYPYFKMLEQQKKGLSDSWAIRWNLSVFNENGLVLFPRVTLVNNHGFDGSGVHCGKVLDFASGDLSFEVSAYPRSTAVAEKQKALIYQFLRASRHFKPITGVYSLIKNLFNKLKV
jgi:hypothetical protein